MPSYAERQKKYLAKLKPSHKKNRGLTETDRPNYSGISEI